MSVAAVLTLAAPLLWAALAELLGQRSGVLNIGIEGVMLISCLGAALAAQAWGPWWAIVAAVIAGAVVNGLFVLVVNAGADQVVAGTGVVLTGMGATALVFRYVQAHHKSAALLPTLSWGPLELGALVAVPLIALFLNKSHAGLVLRACGENPAAVAAAGTPPQRVRSLTLLVAGGLIGLGGATLVLRASGAFVEGMTAGRGFLALAVVLLGRWRPLWIAAGCLLLGSATALQFHVQGLGMTWVSYHFLLAFPYLLTLVVLALVPADRLGGPEALGRAYRGQR